MPFFLATRVRIGFYNCFAISGDCEAPWLGATWAKPTAGKEFGVKLEISRNYRRRCNMCGRRDKNGAREGSHESNETEVSYRH
jgi:hypothetical protein